MPLKMIGKKKCTNEEPYDFGEEARGILNEFGFVRYENSDGRIIYRHKDAYSFTVSPNPYGFSNAEYDISFSKNAYFDKEFRCASTMFLDESNAKDFTQVLAEFSKEFEVFKQVSPKLIEAFERMK